MRYLQKYLDLHNYTCFYVVSIQYANVKKKYKLSLTGKKAFCATLGHYACPERFWYMRNWFVEGLSFQDDLKLPLLF